MKKKLSVFVVSGIILLATFAVYLYSNLNNTNHVNLTRNHRDSDRGFTLKVSKGAKEDDFVKSTSKAADKFIAGGKEWKLIFSNRTLSVSAQFRIYYDLNLVFGNFQKFEIDTLNPPVDLPDGKQLDRRVRFEGGARIFPAALKRSNFACLFHGGSESELFVPDEVSNAYMEAFKLVDQHEAAFDELERFLAKMSDLKNQPIENVRDLFTLSEDIKNGESLLTAPADLFAEAWGGKLYRYPSILDIAPTAGTRYERFQKYGEFIVITYTVSSGVLQELPPLIYQGGKWRFLILPT